MSRGEGSLGFIGLGAMGSAMCRSLMRAGRAILGYDIDAGRLAASVDDGVSAAGSGEEIVSQADVVLTSLRSSAIWAEVAETVLLPNAREGQLF
ncbi:MAG TPA: NAD(P)-binding domain-containing protein, partial [Armatimonadota bacterium]|nr:NAD(P)-binding domain-containing protein [Armatimonadota bacterium]